MTTQLYAGDRLEHPAIQRTLDSDGAIRFTLTGNLDRDAAGVLGRLVRTDLLASRGVGLRAVFVLDCAGCLEMEPRALDALKGTTKLVMEEMGSVVFENVEAELHALLVMTHFDRVFTVRRA